MKNILTEHLSELIINLVNCPYESSYLLWREEVLTFLAIAINDESRFIFDRESASQYDGEDWQKIRSRAIGALRGIIVNSSNQVQNSNNETEQKKVELSTKEVFIVHGHDAELKETSARYVEKLGLHPIILHEKPNSGSTIIEKFEQHADVPFAIILLTPDDVGGEKDNELKPRARQNVIFEFGYFIGKLGRNRVCALHKGDVELPSDYDGVLYIKVDSEGAWKQKLAQEMVEAKLTIDLKGILQ